MLLTQVNDDAAFARSTDPLSMLAYLCGKASERKLQLFFLAILRKLGRPFSQELIDLALEIAALAAEQPVSEIRCKEVADLVSGWQGALPNPRSYELEPLYYFIQHLLVYYLGEVNSTSRCWYIAAWRAAIYASQATKDESWNWLAQWTLDSDEIIKACAVGDYERFEFFSYNADPQPVADLLREIFSPHPSSPPEIPSSWLSSNRGTIGAMARSIYEAESFRDLPILADALEEAGCSNGAIRNHCRQGGEHVRGCWVLDLLLGKQ